MIMSGSVQAHLRDLREVADRKQVEIKVHMPITGTYFTLRDSRTHALIGRYDTVAELDDALTNRADDPDTEEPR